MTPQSVVAVPMSPWSDPQPVGAPINSAADERGAALASDRLTLYFDSDRAGGAGGFDIWVSRRVTAADPWGPPDNITIINGPQNESAPSLSSDGLWLFFASNRYGNSDIYVSHSSNPGNPGGWGPPKRLGSNVNTNGPEYGPMLLGNPDDPYAELYLNRGALAGAQADIYRVAITPQGGTTGPAVPVTELNVSGANDGTVSVRSDGRELFFWSQRSGNDDLWTSTRQSREARWSPPVRLDAPFSTASAETSPTLSFDAQTLIFSSERTPSLGGSDLWMATRVVSWLSDSKAITAFSFAGLATSETIDENAKTIGVTVPHSTDVTALVATFTTTGASVRVGSTVQASGVTPNNFSSPVVYTVTAADGSTASYTVTVTVAPPPSSDKAITAFSFSSPTATGTIDEEVPGWSYGLIKVTVPNGTEITSLAATFTTTGADVYVGSTKQVSGSTANNFTDPVVYTVKAEDGSQRSYKVIVTSPSSARVTHFEVWITYYYDDGTINENGMGLLGTIDEGSKTIRMYQSPWGYNAISVDTGIETTGVSVRVGSTEYPVPSLGIVGFPYYPFPGILTVTALDGTTVDYLVQ